MTIIFICQEKWQLYNAAVTESRSGWESTILQSQINRYNYRLLDGASLHLFLPLALQLYTHHK